MIPLSWYMALSAIMFAAQDRWSDPQLYYLFIYGWCGLDVLITVAALPISMRLCSPRVAATQFTLYMACSNFGITIGAWVFGFSDALGGLRTMFLIVFALHAVGLITMLMVKFPRRAGIDPVTGKPLDPIPGPLPVVN